MEKYFFALLPEKRLTDLIYNQKNFIRELSGEQIYLSEPPHITLYVLTVKNKRIFSKLEELTSGMNIPPISLKDFNIFYNDLQTRGNTITYSLDEESAGSMRKIQSTLINTFSPFNTKELFSKPEIYDKMTPLEKENTDNYGFPFVGKNWIPHLTLASINKQDFSRVWKEIRKKQIKGKFLIESLGLYNTGANPLKLIRGFILKQPE